MSWLNRFISAGEEGESPSVYYQWAGLATISSIISNRVWLNRWHAGRLYPNIYVLNVGPTAIRKGPPMALAKDVANLLGSTRIISGRNSIESIIKELSLSKTAQDGSILKDAVGFIISDEFANLMIRNQDALTIMTQLYDTQYHKEWKNTLKNSPVEILKNPCLTLLGASNEVHLKDAVPLNAIGGGFIGRTMVAYSDKKGKPNSLVYQPKKVITAEELAAELKPILKIHGEFSFCKDAGVLYDKWYNGIQEHQYKDTTGLIERLHDHVTKTAMLLAIAKRGELQLNCEDVEESIDLCVTTASGTNRVFVGSGIALTSAQTTIVIKFMMKYVTTSVPRSQILSRLTGDIDYLEFDRIAEHLSQSGIIKILDVMGKQHYQMTKEAYASIHSFMEKI